MLDFINKKAYQLDLNDKVVCAFKGHATPIRSLALSPDNTFLAAGCCDEFSTRIWQFNDGQTRAFSFGQALLSGDCSLKIYRWLLPQIQNRC
ncbi:MAG: hypothetical protein IPH31_14500 [Lewinellaceae bacterium]|nr:hypothetical protein [Lewinellaceae bacterium]